MPEKLISRDRFDCLSSHAAARSFSDGMLWLNPLSSLQTLSSTLLSSRFFCFRGDMHQNSRAWLAQFWLSQVASLSQSRLDVQHNESPPAHKRSEVFEVAGNPMEQWICTHGLNEHQLCVGYALTAEQALGILVKFCDIIGWNYVLYSYFMCER